MSDTATAVRPSTPSFEVFMTAASAACPWYATATKEQLPLLYADYQSAAANGVVLADYLTDQAAWSSAAEYLEASGIAVPEPEETAPKQWARFETAADNYASKTGAAAIEVGKQASKYITAVLKGQTDAGLVRALRSKAVDRIDGYLLDSCAAQLDSGKAMRLFGVACVFGDAAAKRLGIGKLRAFESCLFREKDGQELWGWKADITADQQAKITAYWTLVADGTVKDGASVVAAQVAALLGKTPKAATTVVAEPTAPDAVEEDEVDVQPDMVPSMMPATATAGHTPMLEDTAIGDDSKPAVRAAAMHELFDGKPDAVAVLKTLGGIHKWTDAEAVALVMGMIDGGSMRAVEAMLTAAVAASQAMAEAAKAAA